jgi:hypothetical protein
MPFQIHALSYAPFEHLFAMPDADLRERNILRVKADTDPGFPCRVSLEDAKIGKELILVNYRHLEGTTPYAASHAIYVMKDATQARLDVGEVPMVLARRLLSVRGFNAQKLMVKADVIDGACLAERLEEMFAEKDIEFVHIHNARQGCFAAKATRQ